MATPFVQGRLLEKNLSCNIRTKCAISGRSITFELDSELRATVLSPGGKPVFFIPMIDLANLKAPNIVDDF